MMEVNLVWQGNSLTSAAWNIIKFFITYISAPKHPQFTTCMKTFLPLITHKIPFFTKSAEKNLWKKPHYTWCTHMIESTCHTHTHHSTTRGWFFFVVNLTMTLTFVVQKQTGRVSWWPQNLTLALNWKFMGDI